MSVTYLVLLAVGLVVIWFGLKTKDDVLMIGSAITGALLLIWGFALTPFQLQLIVEILIVVAVFPICLKCLRG
jgi:hypothetical protein